MAEIQPFRALHYNPATVPDLAKIVTQPYDKITPEMQARYYDLSPYNLVRVIRGRPQPGDSAQDNVYLRAVRDYQAWIQNRILVSTPEPALYPYFQDHTVPGGPGLRKQRRGFIALCRLADYSAGIVHRHEETLSAPKADRLELLKATCAHFGQIFLLYSDPAGDIEARLAAHTQPKPWEQVTDEYGTLHSVWRLTDPTAIGEVKTAMRERKLVIADGHHRYETALAYRDLCRASGRNDERAEYVMATFIRMETDGLTILPTHRVVRGLPEFDWSRFCREADRIFERENFPTQGPATEWGSRFLEALETAGREHPALGAYAGPGILALLRLRKEFDLDAALSDLPRLQRRLDVVVAHRLVLETILGIDRQAVREEKHLHYVRELEAAVRAVEQRSAQLCLLLNPTPVEAVRDNALAGHPLPQKSTDFYPKLLSGLTIYWLDNPSGL
jgi:uncharacterized protein (DUF1015 family)